MKSKPYFRLFAQFQGLLFTGYGLILKSLDDSYANKFLIVGVGLLILFNCRLLFRGFSRYFQKRHTL